MVNVALVEANAPLRRVLLSLLAQQPDMQVVAEATNRSEAVQCVATQAYDVLLLDLTLPGDSGFRLVAALRHLRPTQRIIVISDYDHPLITNMLIMAGAAAHVAKKHLAVALMPAIRALL